MAAKAPVQTLEQRAAYIKDTLKIDPAIFKSSGYNIAAATKAAPSITKFQSMGMKDFSSSVNAKGVFDATKAEESLIKDVYKLDPAEYKSAPKTVADTTKPKVYDSRTGKSDYPKITIQGFDIAKANQKYQFEQPKVTKSSGLEKQPENLLQAVNYYTRALSEAQKVGINNLNTGDQATLKDAARLVRDFKTGELSKSATDIIDRIGDVETKLNEIERQREVVTQANASVSRYKTTQQKQAQTGIAIEEEKKLNRLISEANQGAPQISELISRIGVQDLAPGIGKIPQEDMDALDKSLADLSFNSVSAQSKLFGKLNINVTDQQILDDIDLRKKTKYDELYKKATSIASDLQGQIDQARQYAQDIPEGDARVKLNDKLIADLQTKLNAVNEDVTTTKGLVDNYKPTTGAEATTALTDFRESMMLPDERALREIRQIDPTTADTIETLTKGYAELAKADIGATTDPATEALRRDIQDKITSQVALGSQLDADERRQYEQAARGAQTARGNIFGVGPAVEEAVTTGLAGEARLKERLGSATNFLSSGQSVTDAMRRDTAFREAATLNRLGAAADFTSSGATGYNMANRRAAEQGGALAALLNASKTTTSGAFTGGQTANNPYMYVDPMAGFRGAQNATNLYGSEADYLAKTYGAYVSAQATTNAANSLPNYISAGGDVLKGVGSLGGTGGFFACWVAREVYGADNPRWIEFREWMFGEAPKWLSNLYLRFGERIAEFIKNKPTLKNIIRKWMDSKIG